MTQTLFPARRPLRRRPWMPLACGALLTAMFLALGTWQVERRAWKLDLIARVEARVDAPAVSAPPPAAWPAVTRSRDEYRHVFVEGRFIDKPDTLVQAVTALGAGFWVMTPLQTSGVGSDSNSSASIRGSTMVMINRGFVPAARRAQVTPAPKGLSRVDGLLRITEPGGGFLRSNDATADRWYSRDVTAIASALGLQRVAPYFIDAGPGSAVGAHREVGNASPSDEAMAATRPPDDSAASVASPVPGLTVVSFPNSHLVYAITWYVLAAMVVGGTWRVMRERRRDRQEPGSPHGTPP